MKRTTFVGLPALVLIVLAAITLTAIAQTPSPSSSLTPTPTQTVNQTTPTPSPQSTPCSTLVKVTSDGIELAGFPNWIIAVVIAVGFVALVIWFKLLRPKASEVSRFAAGGMFVVALLAIAILVGYSVGRRNANQELQEIIVARSQQAIIVEVPQPTPQPAPIPTPGANEEFWRETASFVRTMRLFVPLLTTIVAMTILMYFWLKLWNARRMPKKY